MDPGRQKANVFLNFLYNKQKEATKSNKKNITLKNKALWGLFVVLYQLISKQHNFLFWSDNDLEC